VFLDDLADQVAPVVDEVIASYAPLALEVAQALNGSELDAVRVEGTGRVELSCGGRCHVLSVADIVEAHQLAAMVSLEPTVLRVRAHAGRLVVTACSQSWVRSFSALPVPPLP